MLKLLGTRKIETFPLAQIKRVRLLSRADGSYCQFAVQATRTLPHEPTGLQVGIDLGLKSFYTDSEGVVVANPRDLAQARAQALALASARLWQAETLQESQTSDSTTGEGLSQSE